MERYHPSPRSRRYRVLSPMQPTKFASGYQRIKSRARDKIEQQCRVIKDLNREIISLKARLEGRAGM